MKAKGKRPKKKIVLFLVEGKSDREALRAAISALYDRIDSTIQVYFPIIREDNREKGGDITSDFEVYPGNIHTEIHDKFLAQFFEQEKIMAKDIHEVVQIVDIDGVFIPDKNIQVSADERGRERYYYADDRIIVPGEQNVEHAQKRNRRKRMNLRHLVSLDKLLVSRKNIPYSIYYFSCNLDHFLHHEANMDPACKRRAACEYADRIFEDDNGVDRFVEAICRDQDACIGMTYEESWEYIQEEGLNSLGRHTNLNILLERIIAMDPQQAR